MKRTIIGGLVSALLALATLLTLSIDVASAVVGPTIYSPEQAGYAATGAHFRFISETFTLPDASKFASNVGSFGLSVQLWSPNHVVVLGISTCTNSTGCNVAGGTPATEQWNAAVAIFDPVTHSMQYSNGASPAMAAGDVVTEQLHYSRISGFLTSTVLDATAGTKFVDSFHVGPAVLFSQARAGAEFACDPFDNLNCSTPLVYNSTVSETHLVTLKDAKITTYSGHRSSWASWWTHSKVLMTRNGLPTGAIDVRPHNLWNFGRNFGIFLEP